MLLNLTLRRANAERSEKSVHLYGLLYGTLTAIFLGSREVL